MSIVITWMLRCKYVENTDINKALEYSRSSIKEEKHVKAFNVTWIQVSLNSDEGMGYHRSCSLCDELWAVQLKIVLIEC